MLSEHSTRQELVSIQAISLLSHNSTKFRFIFLFWTESTIVHLFLSCVLYVYTNAAKEGCLPTLGVTGEWSCRVHFFWLQLEVLLKKAISVLGRREGIHIVSIAGYHLAVSLGQCRLRMCWWLCWVLNIVQLLTHFAIVKVCTYAISILWIIHTPSEAFNCQLVERKTYMCIVTVATGNLAVGQQWVIRWQLTTKQNISAQRLVCVKAMRLNSINIWDTKLLFPPSLAKYNIRSIQQQ